MSNEHCGNRTKARALKTLMIVLSSVALAVVLVVLGNAMLRRSDDTVAFTIIDDETGQPVTNVTVVSYSLLTALQVERLGIRSYRTETNICETGSITISGIARRPRRTFESQVHFVAPGYLLTLFVRSQRDHVVSAGQGPVSLTENNEVMANENPVTIRLRRRLNVQP